jgi:hypothetical protein
MISSSMTQLFNEMELVAEFLLNRTTVWLGQLLLNERVQDIS